MICGICDIPCFLLYAAMIYSAHNQDTLTKISVVQPVTLVLTMFYKKNTIAFGIACMLPVHSSTL